MRIRPAPVAVLAALVALAGCKAPDEGAQRPVLGTHSSCQKAPPRAPTRPFQSITVDDGSIVVEPDTVVQLPRAGVFGWMSGDHHWRITYAGEQSPIDSDSIMRVGGKDTVRTSPRKAATTSAASGGQSGQASTGSSVSVSGEPGQLVWSGVRADAPCKYYKYEIEVWGGDLEDTLTVDPGGIVSPY